MYQNNCGDITIYNTVTKVQATKGFNCANSIGAGLYGTCGTVTIGCSLDGDGNPVGGTVCWQNNAAVGDGGTYLSTSPCVYCPPVTLTAVTSANLGWIVGSDGKAYMSAFLVPVGTTAVAMITYVGDGDDSDSHYNHGLALALEDTEDGIPGEWCDLTTEKCLNHQYSSRSDAMNDMSGIDNTIEAPSIGYHGYYHRAGLYASEYNSATHPEGTSDWFLASAGQWHIMVTAAGGFTSLRDGFSGVGGTNMESDSYWTSTEYDNSHAWLYRFNNDHGLLQEDKDQRHYVRACLAF